MLADRTADLTNTALTIVDVLERNQISTYNAEKILWAVLSSIYLSEVDDGKRSSIEVMDIVQSQLEILAEEIRLQRQVQENGR